MEWTLEGLAEEGYTGKADTLRESLLGRGLAWKRGTRKTLDLDCFEPEEGTQYVIGVEYDIHRNAHSHYDSFFIPDIIIDLRSYLNIDEERWDEFMKSTVSDNWHEKNNHERIIAIHNWFFIEDFDFICHMVLEDIEAEEAVKNTTDEAVDAALMLAAESLMIDADADQQATQAVYEAMRARIIEYAASKAQEVQHA